MKSIASKSPKEAIEHLKATCGDSSFSVVQVYWLYQQYCKVHRIWLPDNWRGRWHRPQLCHSCLAEADGREAIDDVASECGLLDSAVHRIVHDDLGLRNCVHLAH